VCLLVVLHRLQPEAPLVVAANRDEFFARPATAMTVLRSAAPRILGGRDEIAGGTWLAVNEHGVFAGLTNVPTPVRDPKRRSRGELPLALTRHADARTAADAFKSAYRPADFNPAWILVGDRASLFYIDMTSGEAPGVTALGPGLHVLENRPLGADSPKVDHVSAALAGIEARRGDALTAALYGVLRDHEIPPKAKRDATREPRRPLETEAACVHAGPYGTRSAAIVVVPSGEGAPRVSFSDGPPCENPMVDASGLWRA
jgi:uncharacterized protein with NRDE domain